MKKLLLLLNFTFSLCGISQAQMGTMKWQFQNREQVRAAVRANAHDVGKSYEIILSARRQGLIRSAVQEYEALIGGKAFEVSPELEASYAFAHHIMSAPIGWNIPFDKARGLVKDDQSAALKVGWYREQALKAKPNSPEVLLTYAIWQFGQNGGAPRALRIMDRVVKAKPKWAEAHYWHAEILRRYADNNLPTEQKDKLKPQYGNAIVQAIQKAEQLDSGFKNIGLSLKRSAYGLMNRPKEALIYFDAYTKRNLGFATYYDKLAGVGSFQRWRDSLVVQAKAAG